MTTTELSLSDWLAQADSRQTSPEIMKAIYEVAEYCDEETLNAIWEDPHGLIRRVYKIATGNGRIPAEDLFWGASGSSWAEQE